MVWSAVEIQRLFNSRAPKVVGRGGGLFELYAQMVETKLLVVEVLDYDHSVPFEPLDRDEWRGSENTAHVHLTQHAARIFSSEPRASQDVPSYGVSDYTTAERVVECGSTPPAKLIRSWAAGFDKFTIFPFLELMGPQFVTLSVEWRTTATLRKTSDKKGLLKHGNNLRGFSGKRVDELLEGTTRLVLDVHKHMALLKVGEE